MEADLMNYLFFMLCSVAFLGLLSLRLKLNRKKREILETEQERLEIQKELYRKAKEAKNKKNIK